MTSLPQETKHKEPSFVNQNNEGTSSYIQNQRGPWESAHIEDMKLMCGTLFLTKSQKTLSLTMKTQ